MDSKNRLYQATKGSGLLDYTLFNRSDRINMRTYATPTEHLYTKKKMSKIVTPPPNIRI